jgi:crotonobetainyl-CoA:carnitine CoA-transferase CaiB-like acyl-CoA transferase
MTTITGTLTVNTAFFREIKQENQHLCDLLTALRGLVGNPSVLQNHTRRLVDLLESLCDQLALHFSLEEAYGYFEDALVIAPRLSERAETLRDEHAELFDAIREIADDAKDSHTRQQIPFYMPYLVERIQRFDEDLQRHESQENTLMFEATQLDIGVGD